MPVKNVPTMRGNTAGGRTTSGTYTVARGDTLSHIARRHGVSLNDLSQANPHLGDPDLIYPGQELAIPGQSQPETGPAFKETPSESLYTVKRGDTMTHIAADHGVSLPNLVAANPQIRDLSKIYPGQQLAIPGVEAKGASHATRGRGQRRATSPVEHGHLEAPTLKARMGEAGKVRLARNSRGPAVKDLQQELQEFGFYRGEIDGTFGRQTHDAVRAFQRSQGLQPDGVVGPETFDRLDDPDMAGIKQATTSTPSGPAPRLPRYEPGSPEAVALFREAAQSAGVPASWAESQGLHNILRRESGGQVGVPNYTYGDRARDPGQWSEIHGELRNGNVNARSSATGLGQLLLRNVDRYYPSGRAGIGDPVEEAAGMLRYIQDRYGNPDRAWSQYGLHHEGY